MGSTLIIVESPTKAKKIQGYLGAGYVVKASMGHIADLPIKDLAVDLETMEETYVVSDEKTIAGLRAAAAKADRVLLASDPDREGEAIAWHLARILKLGKKAERVEFHAITEAAVKQAVASPRAIDAPRVNAQRARRVLDRIVGYETSRVVCWPAGAQSAGRVQTPALHLLCARERQIAAFTEATFWTLTATYGNGLVAVAVSEEEPAAPEGAEKSEGSEEGEEESVNSSGPKAGVARRFTSEAEATAYRDAAAGNHRVQSVARARTKRSPGTPYTTSTCYQDAKRKLNLSTEVCAQKLQQLFENGLITYHRTDSTRVDPAFVETARAYLTANHPKAVAERAPATRTKAGAQDAHEAIRPTQLDANVAVPEPARELYRMIRARFLASQCRPAQFDVTQVRLTAGETVWVADGSILVEEGFLEIWGPYARQEDVELPEVAEGDDVGHPDIALDKRKTSPPTRYDDASLTKKLESAGIGRPSTFASIIATLRKRQYAETIEGKRNRTFLAATELGLRLDDLLTEAMPTLVTEEYTAEMEAALDRIADAEDGLDRNAYLKDWYKAFEAVLTDAGTAARAYATAHGIQPRGGGGGGEATDISCDQCRTATYVKIKNAKGTFLKCDGCGMFRVAKAKVRKDACQKCQSNMIQYTVKDSDLTFWACARGRATNDACDYRESAPGVVLVAAKTTKGTHPCPKCRKGHIVHIAKGDRAFLACSERACKFTADVDSQVRAKGCPDCKGDLTLRKAQKSGKKFWGCCKYPECKFLENATEETKGTPLFTRP